MMKSTMAIDMSTLRVVRIKQKPKSVRVWLYQWPGESVAELTKEGRWWYYNSPNGGGEVGCDKLGGAKGDIEYGGGKVWCETRKI